MAYFPGLGSFEQLFGSGRGKLINHFPKIQMPGEGGGGGGC